MPLGISESIIRRAYGPIDLSQAYNKIESFQRLLAAEERAKRQEAQKKYYTDLAAMEKEKAGVRSIDIPEVSKIYKEWSDTEKQLASNPNLINRNPEIYGQLKNKSNQLYSTLVTTIRGSKELAKQEVSDFREMANPQKMDFYKDNAAAEYKQSVMNRPWSEVFASGASDITKYYEPRIDGSKFYGDLGQRIESQAIRDHQIVDKTFKGVPGEVRFIEFKKMPMLGEIPVVIAENLSAKLGKKADKFATQELSEAKKTGDYEDVKNRWNDFMASGYMNYFEKDQPVISLFGKKDISNKQDYINYLTAKEYLSKLPEGKIGKAQFLSESAAARYRESIRKVKGDEDTEVIDIWTPTVGRLQRDEPSKLGVSVDKFDSNTQRIMLSEARSVTGANWLGNRNVYAKFNPAEQKVALYTMQDIKDAAGNVVYKRNQKIGTLAQDQMNIIATKPLGVKAVKEVTKLPKTTTPSAKTWADKYKK